MVCLAQKTWSSLDKVESTGLPDIFPIQKKLGCFYDNFKTLSLQKTTYLYVERGSNRSSQWMHFFKRAPCQKNIQIEITQNGKIDDVW